MEKEKLVTFVKAIKKRKKFLVIVIGIVMIVIILLGIKLLLSQNKGGRVSTISKSSLEKVIEINELSTVDYTYNSIAKAYAEDGKTIKYHVAYEGTVTAGIDFTQISIEVKEEEKKVIITLPDIEIQDTRIDMGTLEYIFTKEKYETETVSQEAYKISKQDLEKRVENEGTLQEMARENAIASVKALFTPWIEQIDEQYTIEIN